jgi:hypothetical protein
MPPSLLARADEVIVLLAQNAYQSRSAMSAFGGKA